jgi:Tfp pilus assembly protein PilN
MTQVNLLPTDVRQRLKTRQVTVLVGMVSAFVVAGLLAFFVLQSHKLASVNNDLSAAQSQNQQLQAKVTSLMRFQQLADQRDAQRTTVQTAKAGTVEFSGVMHDLSMVIPSTVYLNTVTANLSLGDGASIQGTTGGVIGGIQFGGAASDHLAVALWLTRLAQVTGWDNSWITASTKRTNNGDGTKTNWVDFTGSVDLGGKAEKAGGK